jgi:hypothetical protein
MESVTASGTEGQWRDIYAMAAIPQAIAMIGPASRHGTAP